MAQAEAGNRRMIGRVGRTVLYLDDDRALQRNQTYDEEARVYRRRGDCTCHQLVHDKTRASTGNRQPPVTESHLYEEVRAGGGRPGSNEGQTVGVVHRRSAAISSSSGLSPSRAVT